MPAASPSPPSGPAEGLADGLALTPTGLLVTLLIGGAFVALFHHFFYVQNFQAMTSPDWSHSYFIPIISLYLLWQRRADLGRLKPEVFWPGLIPLVLGIMCYVLFQLSLAVNNHMLRGFSMILSLYGLILLLLGTRIAAIAFLPLIYLVFGVTLAEKIMQPITFQLRFLASEGSAVVLNMVGVTTDLKGNLLEVHSASAPGGIVPLNVADACAGMRMVIAFIALGAAVAIVGVRHWWQRAALLLLAVPVALVMNIVRVAVLGMLVLVDPKLSEGESHMLIGHLLLVPAFLLFMGMVWALNMIVIEPPETKQTPPPWWRPGPIRWGVLVRPAVLTALLIFSGSALALPAVVKFAGVYLSKLPIYAPGDGGVHGPETGRKVRAIPVQTASWKRLGDDILEKAEMVEELGTKNYLTRSYVGKKPGARGQQVRLDLHVAYYTGVIDAVPHIPERCMVAGGWEIVGQPREIPLKLDQSSWRPHPSPPDGWSVMVARLPNEFSDAPGSPVTLPRDADKISLRITEFRAPKGEERLYGGYFFLANGGVCASAESVRSLAFELTEDYAYYCKVQISSGSVGTPEEFGEQASSLLGELLPEIMRCVPDWVEVRQGLYPPDNPRRPGRGPGGAAGAGKK